MEADIRARVDERNSPGITEFAQILVDFTWPARALGCADNGKGPGLQRADSRSEQMLGRFRRARYRPVQFQGMHAGLLHRESRLEQHSAVNLKFLSFKPQARNRGTSLLQNRRRGEACLALTNRVFASL